MKIKFIIYITLLVFVISCKKDIYESDKTYAGNWTGKDGKYVYTLDIDESSNAVFEIMLDTETKESHSGKMRKENEKLVMSGLYVFTAIVEPYKLDTAITFVLHNYEYPVTYSMKLKTPKSWGGAEITYYK